MHNGKTNASMPPCVTVPLMVWSVPAPVENTEASPPAAQRIVDNASICVDTRPPPVAPAVTAKLRTQNVAPRGIVTKATSEIAVIALTAAVVDADPDHLTCVNVAAGYSIDAVNVVALVVPDSTPDATRKPGNLTCTPVTSSAATCAVRDMIEFVVPLCALGTCDRVATWERNGANE